MQAALAPRLALSSLLLASVAGSGCGLISADFEGDIKLRVSVGDPTDPDNRYEDLVVTDPEDNADYRENKDKIKSGQVTAVELEFINITPGILSNLVVGEAHVRKQREGQAPNEGWVQAVGVWEGVQVIQGNKFRLTLPAEGQRHLNRIVFDEPGPIELRLTGVADRGPVAFEVQVTLFMRFTAGL